MGFYEDHLNKQLQEKEQEQRLFERIKEQLRTEERFVNFFKGYDPASVEQFIGFYAQQKIVWHRRSDKFEKYAAQQLERDREQVVHLLEHIMTKKIFNLKCRWVAGEMDLEDVLISLDLNSWKSKPSLIKEVGPITADEFYCYLDYYREGSPERLDEDGDEEASPYGALLSYHDYRSNYGADPVKEIPDWFHRYDRHFGTAHLMHLPATRTDMEQEHEHEWRKVVYYPSLGIEAPSNYSVPDLATKKRMYEDPEYKQHWMEENRRQFEEQQAGRPKYESFSTYNRKVMKEVVRAIEPREVQSMYHNARKWQDLNDQDEELFTPLRYLQKVEEYVAISPNDDYREAIKETYEYHQRQTNLQALELLFEEYEACQRSGQQFDWGATRSDSGAAETRKRILALRAAKGLPQNFDFLLKKNLP